MEPDNQNTNFHRFKDEKSKVEKRALTLSIYKAEDTTSAEVCSLSETVSTDTSIANQIEETRKRVDTSQPKLQKNRSFPGERRERTVVHGARNNNNVGSVRLVQCRDQTSQKIGNGGTGRRRDAAENSLRRSRSQATVAGAGAARPVMGRSPYVRKPNRSTASIGIGTAENGGRKTEKPATTEKWPYAGESLENPLVSLECFIFI